MGKNFYFLGTILDLSCSCKQTRDEFAPEAKMSTFHPVEERRGGLRPPTETENRLSLGRSAIVIVGLSALSWAVLIAIVVALRAVL